MKEIKINFKNTLLNKELIEKEGERLDAEIQTVRDLHAGYETPYSFINLPFDEQYQAIIEQLVSEKKQLKPTLIVVIGIGGSNLGTIAIIESVLGKFYNEDQKRPKIYFADTVDTNYINAIYQLCERELENDNTILINAVTKSGTTTETIANFEVFLNLLIKYRPADYQQYVVVTTDQGSCLEAIAQEKKFAILSIPKQVGGRYSVFSAVGLFAFVMLDIDIRSLLAGARDITTICISKEIENNYAAKSAIIKYLHYKNDIIINDLFVFSVQLESIGKWYRQLMGESIGKEFDTENQRVNTGITPTVSVGSIDLHSVGQLYLGGPRDKFITFLTIEKLKNELTLPTFKEFDNCVANIQGKSLSYILDAIVKGVKIAYQNDNRPFYSIELPELSAYYVGQLLQMYMIEMVYLGYLLKVNPFDQPNVELYKKETRKILAQ
ncbi:MAG: hypothetical protein WDZ41_00765 [Candidatus Babeliales bacterium]